MNARSKRKSYDDGTATTEPVDDAAPDVAVVVTTKDIGVKRRRGSSRGARRAEDIERRVSKSVRRVARAVDHGVARYIDARDRSASKRRDGALVDFYENVAKGVSEAVAESSPALVDIAKAFNTRRSRRQIRRAFKNLPRIPFVL